MWKRKAAEALMLRWERISPLMLWEQHKLHRFHAVSAQASFSPYQEVRHFLFLHLFYFVRVLMWKCPLFSVEYHGVVKFGWTLFLSTACLSLFSEASLSSYFFSICNIGQCHSYRVRAYWMIHRGPGFLVSCHRMTWLLPLPPPLPSVSSIVIECKNVFVVFWYNLFS